jgi:hypothetical protein
MIRSQSVKALSGHRFVRDRASQDAESPGVEREGGAVQCPRDATDAQVVEGPAVAHHDSIPGPAGEADPSVSGLFQRRRTGNVHTAPRVGRVAPNRDEHPGLLRRSGEKLARDVFASAAVSAAAARQSRECQRHRA